MVSIEEFSDLGIMKISDLIKGAEKREIFTFDLETTGLNPRRDRIDGISFYLPPVKDLPAERVWYPFVKDTMVVVRASCTHCDWEALRIKATNKCPVCNSKVQQEWESLREPLDQEEIMEGLRELFSIPSITCLAHHIKFDASFIRQASGLEEGIPILCKWADSMVAHYIHNETLRRYGLKQSVERVFKYKMTSYKEAMVNYTDRLGFGWGDGTRSAVSARRRRKVDNDEYFSDDWSCMPLGAYAMDDVEWTWKLFDWSMKSIRRQDPSGRLEKVFWNIEMPITKIITEMEGEGVFIDWEHLDCVSKRLGEEKIEIYKSVTKELLRRLPDPKDSELALDGQVLFGWGDGSKEGASSVKKGEARRDWSAKPPNFNSPQDVAHLLYSTPELGGLELEGDDLQRTPGGKLPTSNKVLQRFKVAEPIIVKGILDWRSRDTIDATFAKKIIKVVEQEPDGRLYAHFNQTGTVIGRLSSSNPVNLMNQPREKGLIRKAFCSGLEESVLSGECDMRLFGCDYDQIELKVAAHLSKDKSMLEVYRAGNVCREGIGGCDLYKDSGRCRHCDIHQRTAEDVGVPRQLAKTLNFGLLYRMGAYTFCSNAGLYDSRGVPRKVYAQKLSYKWFRSYYGIKEFHEKHAVRLPRNNFVTTTITGRRRRLHKEYKFNEFKAVTQSIQFAVSGSSQDIMKIAMRGIMRRRSNKVEFGGVATRKQWKRVKFLLQIHDEIIMAGPTCLDREIKDMVEGSFCSAAELLVPLTATCQSGRTWDCIH